MNLEQEKKYQQAEMLINSAAIVSGIILAAILYSTNHEVLSAVVLFGFVGLMLVKRLKMVSMFADREITIRLKQQVLHLYAWSEYPNDPDVMRRATDTAKALENADNRHGVKVWVMMYGSPYFYALRYEKGELKVERAIADIAPNYEMFTAQVNDFIKSTSDQRKRELHGGGKEKDVLWASTFVHNQN